VVGDSASGKTTISRGLMHLLGADNVTHICTDDYHKYDRQERAQRHITALHPDCNYLDILELHLEHLHHGQPILKPVYNHANGTLTRPEYVQPRDFVIVEGLLGFYSARMCQCYDLKVFLDPAETLRQSWKIQRDSEKRGYTIEQVREQLQRREPDSQRYIRPQRDQADIVVRFYPAQADLADLDAAAQAASSTASTLAGPLVPEQPLNVQLILRHTTGVSHPDLSYLMYQPPAPDAGIRLYSGRDNDCPVDILEVDGEISTEEVTRMEDAIGQHIPAWHPLRAHQFGYYYNHVELRHSHPLALTQLLLSYHVLRRYGHRLDVRLISPVAPLSPFLSVTVPEHSDSSRELV
jgi:phosphoribulokinase